MPPIGARVLLLALGLGLLNGCSGSPLDRRVAAQTVVDYNMWLSDVGRDAPPGLMADIGQASTEIKLALMGKGPLGGTAAADMDFLAKVNGLTLRQLLTAGFDDQVHRLEAEQRRLTASLARQTSLGTLPGDTASADYLANLIRDNRNRLAEVNRELTIARTKLTTYRRPAGRL